MSYENPKQSPVMMQWYFFVHHHSLIEWLVAFLILWYVFEKTIFTICQKQWVKRPDQNINIAYYKISSFQSSMVGILLAERPTDINPVDACELHCWSHKCAPTLHNHYIACCMKCMYVFHGAVLQMVYELIIQTSKKTYSALLCQIMIWSGQNFALIRSKFCTCHGSTAALTCAKFWPDQILTMKITA